MDRRHLRTNAMELRQASERQNQEYRQRVASMTTTDFEH